MKTNNITIVICLYNAENYIVKTLESLDNQTLKDFNLLIIDDCSPDNSIRKVKDFFQTSSFQTTEIIHFDVNKGTAYARNFALHHVKTPLMMFFDADDIAKANLLEKLYTKINENENNIAISCYSKYIDIRSNKIVGGQFIGPISKEYFLQRAEEGKLIFMLPPTLFKREFAIQAGGYRLEGFASGKPRYQDLSEDLDMWSRMSDFYASGKIMLTIPEVLFYYRKNTSSLSASKDSLIAMQNKIRYIKQNLKRRRAGTEDLIFIDYIDSLTSSQKVKHYFKDTSAFYYRKAGFSYVAKSYISFIYFMTLSVIFNPLYIVDKVKSNFMRKA
ncbi:MAG: glycosyltransferase family 2 protein [Bacteroidales bacterium]|nr:glycosyltransferase family 2 protein [Bacteroidales bacterium]